MDRGAWQATFHGVPRERQDLGTKPPRSWRLDEGCFLSSKKWETQKGFVPGSHIALLGMRNGWQRMALRILKTHMQRAYVKALFSSVMREPPE